MNSGSEANELALRLARTAHRRQDVIVLEHAYHGHTTTLVDVSPYKFAGPGGRGQGDFVHVAPLPDTYRGRYRRDDPRPGRSTRRSSAPIASGSRPGGRKLAAFLAETLPSVAGQIVFPPGYLADAYRHVRAAGGVAIADEVQTGFGRLGEAFWGFETQDAVPDVVVLGKPIGERLPARSGRHHARDRCGLRQRHGVLQHLRRQPGRLRRGARGARRAREEQLQENARRVGRTSRTGCASSSRATP